MQASGMVEAGTLASVVTHMAIRTSVENDLGAASMISCMKHTYFILRNSKIQSPLFPRKLSKLFFSVKNVI